MKNFILILISVLIISCGGRNKDNEQGNRASGKTDDKNVVAEGKISEEVAEEIIEESFNRESRNSYEPPNDKSVSELFYELEKGVFVVHTLLDGELYSQGSGFFISNGIGITNFHVLAGSDQGFIQLSNDEVFEITEILASSPPKELDYVIFKTNNLQNKFLKISKRIADIGEDVFAIGSPKGLNNSLTKGTISGFRPNHRIQIDATIDHGSSGGPLFNLQGEVVGITTSGIGTGSELNFAVDIQSLPYKRFVRD